MLRCSGLLLCGVLVAACASGPYIDTLYVQGGEELNPTSSGPSAVNIRVFRLKDKEGFEQASLESLLEDDPKLPAGTWVSPHWDAVVYVSEPCKKIALEIKRDVRWVGVVGMFNEPDRGTTKVTIPVGELGDQKLFFDGFAVELKPLESGDY